MMDKEAKNHLQGFSIRFATQEDVTLILSFIRGLAEYEEMSDQVVATEEGLRESLFEKRQAEVLIATEDGRPVGFALFFHNYSTFLGKANLYLEDLFIAKDYRGRGYGKALLTFLGKVAVDRNCSRLDWLCLKWNEPAIDFYEEMGAIALDEWTVFRVEGENLKMLGLKQDLTPRNK